MSQRKEFRLTNKGLDKVRAFLTECEAKRKEILDAKKDTADDTEIPSVEDILSDINCGVGIDADGEYYNNWGVTDNCESDHPLSLSVNTDLEEHTVTVRQLTESDASEVNSMDDLSYFYVEQWLDGGDMAWGIFDDQRLMGYCTLGCADCCEDLYGKDDDYTYVSYVLSDVFVSRRHRHHGYGRELIQNAIRETWQRDKSNECIYLSPMNDYVANWYETLGFKGIGDNAMKLKVTAE